MNAVLCFVMRMSTPAEPASAKALPEDVDTLKALVLAERAENDRLRAMLKAAQRALYGRRSERIDPHQLPLKLNDSTYVKEAERDKAPNKEPAPPPAKREPQKRRCNRGALPNHLPRVEEVVEPTSKACPCCAGTMHVIGEETSQRLDIIPTQFRVIVTRRPKYACRTCEGAVVQAPAPARLIEGGLPTERLIAQVAVYRYADHLPMYRLAQIFSRDGVNLDRSTLCDWMIRGAFEIMPIYRRMFELLKCSTKLFMDETRAPVLEPGRGRTKSGYFWSVARDDRPWCGTDPPMVVYLYAPGRGSEHAICHLDGFKGILQVDGYAGYKVLLRSREDGGLKLAFCWAHSRRQFYELAKSDQAPIAEEALSRIQKLYRIEKEIAGLEPEVRKAVRQEKAKPILEKLHAWLRKQLECVAQRSRIAEAIRYTLNHWDGLVLYIEDGRIEIDSNTVERTIKPLALSRKNALFAFKDEGGERWAVWASLIETCKLLGVNPLTYLTDVLTLLVNGHPMSRLDELMPWNWVPREADETLAAA